ncbi:MAG TPA: trypsin-like peptidase domain-containing protein [Candidatus Obscuribacterales bacterium]
MSEIFNESDEETVAAAVSEDRIEQSDVRRATEPVDQIGSSDSGEESDSSSEPCPESSGEDGAKTILAASKGANIPVSLEGVAPAVRPPVAQESVGDLMQAQLGKQCPAPHHHTHHPWSTTIKVLVALLIVNAFAVGIWIGTQILRADREETMRRVAISQLDQEPLEIVPEEPRKTPSRVIGDTTIADIAQKVAPAVVTIDVAAPRGAGNSSAPPSESAKPQFFFGPRMQPEPVPEQFGLRYEKRTAGSGFIIRSDGYILTNSHVARKDSLIKVTLNDKRVFQGRLVGRDTFTDLALLKIDADNLPVVKLGTSKGIRPGDWAIAIGNPFGFEHSVTLGIISAIGRSLADLNHHVELIQTDAAINPGNSGGPLLNLDGQVIGINTAIRFDAQNIGFAIPVDVAREVADGLLVHHAISRPYLGLYMRDLDPRIRAALGLGKDTKGVLVRRVVAGGPSARAKIAPGDLIQKVNNIAVGSSKEMREVIQSHKPGDTLDIQLSRKGTSTEAKLVIGDYSKEVVDD